MNDFNRCNKVTGIHWFKSPVENIQIKVKLKPRDGILSLPKFEDYGNETNSINLQTLENQSEEFIFKWQEKVFSSWEIQRYTDRHNCLSDTELIYHDMIKDIDCVPSKVFTYIHEDNHLPLPSNLKNNKKVNVLNLSSCLERLNLGGGVERILGEDSSSMRHLFRSEENISSEVQWTTMHVVFDNSDYNEDSRLLLKQETTLLSLYHNTAQNYLIISPDVNDLELNPYSVEAAGASGYQYGVHVGFEETGGGEDLDILLRKLCKKWEKNQKQLLNFATPPLGKKQYCIALEVLSATGFDMDNLYIEYHIKVPETAECSDALHGRTHTSKSLRRERADEWLFGHIVDLNLEMAASAELLPLKIFFEVISKDWWGRHRTEGYTYLPLTLDAGRYSKQLSCSRPEELHRVDAESRRFFIGGCHLIKDLEILVQPQLKDANFKFVSTGRIAVRWSVISQAHSRAAPTPDLPGTSSASALLLGAEAVLRKYRKARARLAAATKDLTERSMDGSGDG